MGWSLLRNSLRPFKIYCASPPITSQLVLFLWQSVEIGPLGHVRVVEALQNFVQKYDPVTFSGIHIHIAVSLALRHLLHKGFISFPILYKGVCNRFKKKILKCKPRAVGNLFAKLTVSKSFYKILKPLQDQTLTGTQTGADDALLRVKDLQSVIQHFHEERQVH